jgi:hypothetical protein
VILIKKLNLEKLEGGYIFIQVVLYFKRHQTRNSKTSQKARQPRYVDSNHKSSSLPTDAQQRVTTPLALADIVADHTNEPNNNILQEATSTSHFVQTPLTDIVVDHINEPNNNLQDASFTSHLIQESVSRPSFPADDVSDIHPGTKRYIDQVLSEIRDEIKLEIRSLFRSSFISGTHRTSEDSGSGLSETIQLNNNTNRTRLLPDPEKNNKRVRFANTLGDDIHVLLNNTGCNSEDKSRNQLNSNAQERQGEVFNGNGSIDVGRLLQSFRDDFSAVNQDYNLEVVQQDPTNYSYSSFQRYASIDYRSDTYDPEVELASISDPIVRKTE